MINWTPQLLVAKQFARDAHDSIKQVRKYSGLPYWVHTEEVAEIVSSVTNDEDMIIAALGHDIIEDVFPINSYYSIERIHSLFGARVASMVLDLTDVYTPENYPHLNRAERKELEAQRLSQIHPDSQTIKMGDLISNTADIAKHDEGFAKLYIKEKKRILEIMNQGNPALFARAMEQIYSFEV